MLMNARSGGVIAQNIEVADTRETRRQGLLGRDSLHRSAAMMLVPCFAVHTAFMRFPIDIIFVDRDGCVVRIARHVGPWRMAAAWRARTVIELAAGALDGCDIRPGDRLYLAAEPAPAGAAVSWPLPA